MTRICADHSLGDPLVYARWAGAMQRIAGPLQRAVCVPAAVAPTLTTASAMLIITFGPKD